MPRRWGRPGWQERLVLGLVLIGFTVFAINEEWLWRWDRVIYDAHLPVLFRPAPSDILIVGIDEQSLATLGRWPWPRGHHARLLRNLKAAGARVVALDIIFAEPDRLDPGADKALEQALRATGNVVLPVLPEQPYPGAQLVESLPIPQLAHAAAALGHVHAELDPDGIARSVYLTAGISTPHWPALPLAMVRLAEPARWKDPPGLRNPALPKGPSQAWIRDHHALIPFAGRPGHFAFLSYASALAGEFDPDLVRDRFVLVGVTATGLGDRLPTPVSGHSRQMSGVEFNANVLDTLLRTRPVKPLSAHWQIVLSGAIVILALALYPRFPPRWTLMIAAGLTVGTLVVSTLLLFGARLWFGPAATLVALIASYPLWSWRRLESAMRFLSRELVALDTERESASIAPDSQPIPSLKFLERTLELQGWVLLDQNGERVAGGGREPRDSPAAAPPPGVWQQTQDALWTGTSDGKAPFSIGILAPTDAPSPPTGLEDALRPLQATAYPNPNDGAGSAIEVVEARIGQVQDAARHLRRMRRFVADSLEQMGNGVVVTTPLGQVALANARAAEYLRGDANDTLVGESVLEVISELHPQDGSSWEWTFKSVLFDDRPAQVNARHSDGHDLLVHLAPLWTTGDPVAGAIVNIADISPLKESERKRNEMLGFVSHDLRAPMVSVLALIELAKAKRDPQAMMGLLPRIESYAGQTLELAEQFLQLARAENPESTADNEIDLIEIAHNAFEQVWAQSRRKGIRMVRRFRVDEAWLMGDPGLLERALVNLLSNAVEHSGRGCTVTLEVAAEGDTYLCAVSDNGPGIDPADLPGLFDRFRQAHTGGRRRERGAGLGLAIVKAVAERHGGQVNVKSSPGAGAEFTLRLPARGTN